MSGSDLLRELALVRRLLDGAALEPLDVPLVEHRGPRSNRLKLRPDLLQRRRLEDPGRARGLVAVLLKDVPGAEHQIVE